MSFGLAVHERISRWALATVYGNEIVASGANAANAQAANYAPIPLDRFKAVNGNVWITLQPNEATCSPPRILVDQLVPKDGCSIAKFTLGHGQIKTVTVYDFVLFNRDPERIWLLTICH